MLGLIRNACGLGFLLIGLLPFALSGCGPVYSTWYRPTALIGYATNGERVKVGKNDEWVLKRQGVTFRIFVSSAKGNTGIDIIARIPYNRTVKANFNNLQVYGSSQNKLKGDFSGNASGYNIGIPDVYKFSSDIKELSGSKYATKRVPATYYYFGLTMHGALPPTLEVFLPRMEINGNSYPSLTIHFTKKSGWYFLNGVM